MSSQLETLLTSLDIKDETIIEYIHQIATSDSLTLEEKLEAIQEFVSEATESNTNEFMIQIKGLITAIDRQHEIKESESRLIELANAREQEQRILKASTSKLASVKKVLSAEEERLREAVLRGYEYEYEDEDPEKIAS